MTTVAERWALSRRVVGIERVIQRRSGDGLELANCGVDVIALGVELGHRHL